METKKITINGRDNEIQDDGSITFVHSKTGKQVNTFGSNSRGYCIIKIGGKIVYVHRLVARAFLSDYSEDLQVDHINGDRSDNRPSNLRMATSGENHRAFRKKIAGASSRFRGVCWDGDRGEWMARIRINGKLKHIGRFQAETEAARAYDESALKHGFSMEALNSFTHTEEY